MTIAEFDHFDDNRKKELLYQCCGSEAWVNSMLRALPAEDLVDLLEIGESNWYACNATDWVEAFSQHPKIGDTESLKEKFKSTAHLAAGEQSSVKEASEQTLQALAEHNKLYELKFGYIFIVCATGKSADEMLALLKVRLQNNLEDEMEIAMEEQNKITRLRLEKLFE
jgi:2-oxo-4-hydroxy-4-carboxy-5-ureidoimidazoline decarboxylase